MFAFDSNGQPLELMPSLGRLLPFLTKTNECKNAHRGLIQASGVCNEAEQLENDVNNIRSHSVRFQQMSEEIPSIKLPRVTLIGENWLHLFLTQIRPALPANMQHVRDSTQFDIWNVLWKFFVFRVVLISTAQSTKNLISLISLNGELRVTTNVDTFI